MEGTCPRCHVRLDLPASGLYECERCRVRFEVALGSPAPAAAPPGSSGRYGAPTVFPPMQTPELHSGLDPALQAPCASHPGNVASRVCERCGDFMCRLCTTPVEGRAYCPKCFDLLYNRGALQFAQRQFTLPAITLALGVCAFFISWAPCLGLISVPMAVGGLVSGTKALKEHRERPELPHRGMTLTGLGFAAASLTIVTAWTALMIAGFVNSS